MTDIKALSDAATQGVWEVSQYSRAHNVAYVKDGSGFRFLSIAEWGDTGKNTPQPFSDAKLICAAVNGIRNGTLVDSQQARRDALQDVLNTLRTIKASEVAQARAGWKLSKSGLQKKHEARCGAVDDIVAAITALMEADT